MKERLPILFPWGWFQKGKTSKKPKDRYNKRWGAGQQDINILMEKNLENHILSDIWLYVPIFIKLEYILFETWLSF